MRRIARFAMVGALALCVGGILAVAADSAPAVEKAPAKVQDLVKAIATAKKMDVREVERFFRNGGLSFDLNAELRGELAARMLERFGFSLSSSANSVLSQTDASRLAAFASFGSFSANALDGPPGDDPSEDLCDAGAGEVCNQAGRGQRDEKRGNLPNTNANINAFESIREDPRE